jgi:AAA15 family ATPase/GTPase
MEEDLNMLTGFYIKNFKSYKNKTGIDLKSTNYKILQNQNVSKNGVLKGLMFVGPNASGKTNAVIALKVLLEMLFKDELPNLFNHNCVFSNEPDIELSYDFIINDQPINYAIKYDFRKSWLSEKLSLNGEVILDRMGNNAESRITENSKFNDLDNDLLLLRTIYFNTKFKGNDTLKSWFEFLSNSAYVNPFKRQTFSPSKATMKLNDYLDENNVTEINGFLTEYNFRQKIEYDKKSSGNRIHMEIDGDSRYIFFKRDGIGEPIPYDWESLGNQNLLNILPPFFHVINHGGMLLIDEFSSGFHNELEELLVKYFFNKSQSSQVIFVTHSTNLLSTSIIRPDQVYSVDFNDQEGSVIKRFSDEKPREAQNLEKMYVSGVFSGLPNYGNI